MEKSPLNDKLKSDSFLSVDSAALAILALRRSLEVQAALELVLEELYGRQEVRWIKEGFLKEYIASSNPFGK